MRLRAKVASNQQKTLGLVGYEGRDGISRFPHNLGPTSLGWLYSHSTDTFLDSYMSETNYPLLVGAGTLLITAVLWSQLGKQNTVAPGEPPMYPGALPIVGHVISFLRDPGDMYMRARWTQDLRPVSVSLVGQRAYFVFNNRDVATIWKTKTLSFDKLVEGGLVSIFGATPEGVKQLQTDPDDLGSLIQYNHGYLKEALAQGGSLELLTRNFINYFDIELQTEVADKIIASANGYIEVPLQYWIRVIFTVASTHAFSGPDMLKTDPEIIPRLWQWEHDFMWLSIGLPKWMQKRAHKNRELMLRAFERHVFDKNSVSFIRNQEKMMVTRGMSNHDIGVANFAFWSAVQANAPVTAFWILHYIHFTAGTLEKVRAEILPAFDASTGKLINLSHLINGCPLLNSVYQEVLRYTSASQTVRVVEEDTIIAGYTFLEGARVMMPVRPYHFDPEIFGNDVDEFVPDRFIRDDKSLKPGQKNVSSKILRAFGGGVTLCPGRHFAANEILAGVAMLLFRFEVEIVQGEKMAKPSLKEATVGTHYADHDVKVRVRIRG